MTLMRLPKLRDRTPVKLATALMPEARQHDYADFYAETYGTRVEVADLVAFILDAFLDGDADFTRASRTEGLNNTVPALLRIYRIKAERGGAKLGGEITPPMWCVLARRSL
jgi:hypothetical protein